MIPEAFAFAAEMVESALGEDFVYEGETIQGVFGGGFRQVESGLGPVRVSSTAPEISVRYEVLETLGIDTSSVAAMEGAMKGTGGTVRGRTYQVTTVRPDVENVSATLVLKYTD